MEKNWNDYVNAHSNIESARAAFEKDCEALLQALHPEETVRVVHANPGDDGIDVYVGDIGVKPITVYQCKFFLHTLGKSQKDQIRESLDRAMTSDRFEVAKWVLCIPMPDLDLQENKWWVEWKTKQEARYGIAIQLMNGSELIHKMKLVGIYNQVFQIEDSLKIADVHRAVTGKGGLAELGQQVALTRESVQRTEQQLLHLQSGPFHLMLDLLEKNELEHFKPFTTLRFLQGLAPQVQQASNGNVQARLNYLLGRAQQETGEVGPAHDYFFEAHYLEPGNTLYAEQAALAYARLDMPAEAVEVVAKIRQMRPLNGVAHAVHVFLHRAEFEEQLVKVPDAVREQDAFKLALVELLLQAKPLDLSKIEAVLKADLDAYTPAAALTYENRRFQVTLALMVVQVEFDTLPKMTRLDQPAALRDSARLRAAHELLKRYTTLLQPTEKSPMLTYHYYVQGIAGLKLSGDIQELAEFGRRYAGLPLAEKQEYAWEWACALFQSGEYRQSLQVIEELGPDGPAELDYVRYHALLQLDEPALAKAALAQHLLRSEPLHEGTFDRLLRYLAGHCADAVERLAFVEDCLARKLVAEELPEQLLRASAAVDEPAQREQVLAWLTQAETLLDDATPSIMRLEMARLFQQLAAYEQSARILASCAVAPGVQHSGIELVRLRNQYHLYQDDHELRAKLQAWRQEYGIFPEFCNWEVELAHLVPDWERILEVTDAVRGQVSAETGVYWTYLLALYRLQRSAELQAALQAVVARPVLLTPDQQLRAAGIATREGHPELALQLAYPLAMQSGNAVARSRYLTLMLHHSQERPQPTAVVPGTSVHYKADGRLQAWLTITESLVKTGTNSLVAQLLGKQAGDSFEHPHPFRRHPQRIEVVEVVDCYTGLLREIMQEIGQNEAIMPVQAFNFGSDTPTIEEINQTFLDILGEQQQETRSHAATVRADYEAGDTTFTQLAAKLHHGNGLEAYHWLISGRDDSPGLRVLPGWLFGPIPDLAQQSIVLDWTSLPLLFALVRQHGLPVPVSLWVSNHLLEELRELVREKRRSKPTEMSVEIIDGEVHPHFYPPEMHARQLDYLNDLLNWVEANCQTRFVEEKLDALRQTGIELNRLMEPPLAGVIDAAFLAPNIRAVVVSDDVTLLQLALQGGGRVLSVEAFLRASYPAQYLSVILPELLDRSYWGIQVEAPTLLREFVAAGHQFKGRAYQALRNAAFQVHHQPERIRALAHFIRELFLLPSLPMMQKQQVGGFVLGLGLCYLELTEATLDVVITHLAQAFFLLPAFQDELVPLLRNAWHRAERYHRASEQ